MQTKENTYEYYAPNCARRYTRIRHDIDSSSAYELDIADFEIGIFHRYEAIEKANEILATFVAECSIFLDLCDNRSSSILLYIAP